jgi:hypothetical protein
MRFKVTTGSFSNTNVTGTAALKQFHHAGKSDYFATATAAGEGSALVSGYSQVGIEGYVFTASHTGMSPMTLWWNATAEDSYTTVDRASSRGTGYTSVRTEGNAFSAGW